MITQSQKQGEEAGKSADGVGPKTIPMLQRRNSRKHDRSFRGDARSLGCDRSDHESSNSGEDLEAGSRRASNSPPRLKAALVSPYSTELPPPQLPPPRPSRRFLSMCLCGQNDILFLLFIDHSRSHEHLVDIWHLAPKAKATSRGENGRRRRQRSGHCPGKKWMKGSVVRMSSRTLTKPRGSITSNWQTFFHLKRRLFMCIHFSVPVLKVCVS